MGYPTQQYPPGNPYGMPGPVHTGGDPFAGSYDGYDPFDNAIPDQRAGRVPMAGPDGRPLIHSDGLPINVTPPSLRTLGVGRLVLVVPKKIERDIPNNDPKAWRSKFDRMTADVIVCDGNPGRFGGDPTRGIDDMLTFPVPCVIEDLWIDKAGIIEKFPESLIGNGFKIGRIVKAKTKNDRTAWNFNSPDEDPARANAIVQSLRPIWTAYQGQQLPILGLKTLAERYGVKPGTATQAVPPAPAQVNLTNPPYAGGSTVPLSGGHAPVQQQPPAWPPMQPGQNMAPIQHGFGVGDPRTDAVPPYGPAQPVSAPQAGQWTPPAPTAALADWTLQVDLNAAGLAMWAPQWQSLTQEVRTQILAQVNITGPASQPNIPPTNVPTGYPGYPGTPPF
jgi:hypothetical protein